LWSAEGGHAYRAATTAFITRDGVLVRTQTITQDIEIGDSPDEFVSVASVEFFDPSGALIMKGYATAVGERYRSPQPILQKGVMGSSLASRPNRDS
jgi:hypothetical protein